MKSYPAKQLSYATEKSQRGNVIARIMLVGFSEKPLSAHEGFSTDVLGEVGKDRGRVTYAENNVQDARPHP